MSISTVSPTVFHSPLDFEISLAIHKQNLIITKLFTSVFFAGSVVSIWGAVLTAQLGVHSNKELPYRKITDDSPTLVLSTISATFFTLACLMYAGFCIELRAELKKENYTEIPLDIDSSSECDPANISSDEDSNPTLTLTSNPAKSIQKP